MAMTMMIILIYNEGTLLAIAVDSGALLKYMLFL